MFSFVVDFQNREQIFQMLAGHRLLQEVELGDGHLYLGAKTILNKTVIQSQERKQTEKPRVAVYAYNPSAWGDGGRKVGLRPG